MENGSPENREQITLGPFPDCRQGQQATDSVEKVGHGFRS
jgi:hypothetical protein